MGFFGDILGAATSLIGGSLGRDSAEDANASNAALQREFAQNGIQWKVADAKKAGIHPLYALGANTTAASPSYVGDTSMGSAVASMGQDIGRAINSTRNEDDRVKSRMDALTIERGELENTLLRSQIAKLNAAPNPSFPAPGDTPLIPGQGDTKDVPLTRVMPTPGYEHSEPGYVTDTGFARTQGGGLAVIPSQDVKNRIEDTLVPEAMWAWRNNLSPNVLLTGGVRPDESRYPSKNGWYWSISNQEWRPVPDWVPKVRNFFSGAPRASYREGKGF